MSGLVFRMHRLGDSLTVCDESVVHAPEMIAGSASAGKMGQPSRRPFTKTFEKGVKK